MKFNIAIITTICLGLVTLFFFPEPETNFLAYVGTALLFIIIITALLIFKKRIIRKE